MTRIVLAGAIAVGKSSLTSRLLDLLPRARSVEEDVTAFAFLERFYGDPARWALHSRIEFLARKCREWHSAQPQAGEIVLHDRGVQELITFARALQERGVLAGDELALYESLYDTLIVSLEPPDAVLWLRAEPDVCLKRIRSRNRSFEQRVTPDYLEELDQQYRVWYSGCVGPKLKIDTGSAGPEEVAHEAAAWITALVDQLEPA